MSDVPSPSQRLAIGEWLDLPEAREEHPPHPHHSYRASGHGVMPSPNPHLYRPTGQVTNPGAFVNTSGSSYHHVGASTSSRPLLSANVSTGASPNVMPAVVLPQMAQGATGGHPFQCPFCLKTFDRRARLENCINRHRGLRPYLCRGSCEDPGCDAEYASIEYLRRHLLSKEERRARCAECGLVILKQNMSRHKESCV